MYRHWVMGCLIPGAVPLSAGCDTASALSRGVYMRPSMFSCCTKPAMPEHCHGRNIVMAPYCWHRQRTPAAMCGVPVLKYHVCNSHLRV